MPGVLLLALFSSRLGGLSARYGARWLLTLGPMLMAVGVLWLSRIPSTSPAWDLSAVAQTFTPPSGYVTSVLPGLLVFGLGATLMVAPLTATVMRSVPVERAGVASAVNTAISDVGPQLAVDAEFLRCAGAGRSWPGRRVCGGAPCGRASQRAGPRGVGGGPKGGARRVHRRVPPRHGRRRGPAVRGSAHQWRGVANTLRCALVTGRVS